MSTHDTIAGRRPFSTVRVLGRAAIASSGPLLAVGGVGGLVMAHRTWLTGMIVVAVGSIAASLIMTVSPTRRRALGAAAVVCVLLPVATWSNVGRAQGFFAAVGVVTLSVVVPSPRRSWLQRSWTGLIMYPVFLVSQAMWVAGWSIPTFSVIGVLVIVGAVRDRLDPGVDHLIDAFLHAVGRAVTILSAVLSRSVSAGLGAVRAALSSLITLFTAALPDDRRARSWRLIWIVGLLGAATHLWLFWRFATLPPDVTGSADYPTHLDAAARTGLFPPRFVTPHPTFFYVVSLLTPLVGQAIAATLVLAAAIGLTVVVVACIGIAAFWGIERLSTGWAAAFGLGFVLVESPSVIAGVLHLGHPVNWAATVHTLGTSTDVLATPFALVMAFAVARCGRESQSTVPGPALAALTVLAAATKPSMNVALLGALPLYALLFLRHDRRTLTHLAKWFVAPSVLALIAQTLFIEFGVSGLPEAEIAIRPFEMIRALQLDHATPVLLAGAFVIVLALWRDPRSYLADPLVGLALLASAVGVGLLVLFNETGDRRYDGAFSKPGTAAWTLLCMASWRFVLVRLIVPGGGHRVWRAVSVAFLALSLASGVVVVLESSGSLPIPLLGA